ncbi:MAG: FMN-binding protein [Candidatus Adiutrix sp.]|jgi:major membrane immunogen (membrane-anchored lipoprotein)|nr:FMN-binding protein [Candidatus Adiutrix sp.]
MGKSLFPARAAFLVLVIAIPAFGPGACSSSPSSLMKDGYYTAEAADFDAGGWKEFLTIYVSDGRIVTAEYNARNAGGFLRSWDMADKRSMNAALGTYPNKYSRAYTLALLNRQDPARVLPIPGGAAQVHPRFRRLAEAAVAQARVGNRRVAFVKPLHRSGTE